jgi:hypothetical protein
MPASLRPARSLHLACIALACCGMAFAPSSASAAPRNPYSGFNLSGINYGAQQWDRAQREGRRVWPYYNTPAPRSGGGTVAAGGFVGGTGGGMIQGGAYRQAPRGARRWRR